MKQSSTLQKLGHIALSMIWAPSQLHQTQLPKVEPYARKSAHLVTHLAHALPRLLETLKCHVNSSNGQALGVSW